MLNSIQISSGHVIFFSDKSVFHHRHTDGYIVGTNHYNHLNFEMWNENELQPQALAIQSICSPIGCKTFGAMKQHRTLCDSNNASDPSVSFWGRKKIANWNECSSEFLKQQVVVCVFVRLFYDQCSPVALPVFRSLHSPLHYTLNVTLNVYVNVWKSHWLQFMCAQTIEPTKWLLFS